MTETLTIPFDVDAMAAVLAAFLATHSLDVGQAQCAQIAAQMLAAGSSNFSFQVKLKANS